MKTIDEGHSMNQDSTSLLEEAVMERNVMYSHFDSMIEDEGEFNITLVTMPDDYIINFHNYLLKLAKRQSFMMENPAFDPKLARLENMISRLEDIPCVQEDMNQKTTKEEEAQIDEAVRIIEERQKVRKMGPIQRFIYNQTKKKNNK